MRCSMVLAAVAASTVSGHGLIRTIQGDNGVTMPGLTELEKATDGTPRNCVVNACGAQADTGIIRDNEINSGKYGPLGWTQGGGRVDICTVLDNWMGKGDAPAKNNGAASSVGVEDPIPGLSMRKKRRGVHRRQMPDLLGDVFRNTPLGVLPLTGTSKSYPTETLNAEMRGQGAKYGLPTPDKKGVITMTYRQINQDGAGPMTCAIDYTSGGQNPKAMEPANVVFNVPGSFVSGLSLATNADFKLQVQADPSKSCTGNVCGVKNVCVVRCRNGAFAGPFGGAAVFTQNHQV